MQRSRTLWVALGLPLFVVAVASSSYSALDYVGRQTERATESVAGSISAVDIRTAGRIHVVGSATADGISVERRIVRGLHRPSFSQRVDGTTLVVRGECPSFSSSCSVNVTVRLPDDVRISARSSGGDVTVTAMATTLDLDSSGGDVVVNDSAGDITLASSGGTVRFDRVTGAVHARSSGGDVRGTNVRAQTVDASSSGGDVRVAFAIAPERISASSSGGGVRVEVPRTTDAYRTSASSSGGSSRVEVKTDPESSRVIDVSSSGGDVRIAYADDPQ